MSQILLGEDNKQFKIVPLENEHIKDLAKFIDWTFNAMNPICKYFKNSIN